MTDLAEDINVDELLSSIESPSPERAMTGGEEPEAAAAETAAPEAPTWDGKAWEFDWNGKKIAPDSHDKARTWMAQGYNYSQRMGELNRTHAERMADAEKRQTAATELEKKFSPYTKVDEYARQNPQWWQHVTQEYERQQQAGNGIDPNLAKIIQPLQQKLDAIEARNAEEIALRDAAAAEETQKREDQALDQGIGEIRKQFPNIDLAATDPATGETLELRILKHAQKIGTGSFEAAFWHYLGPKLAEQAKASGLEAKAKEAQVNAKKGILGKSPTPLKTGLKPVNTKARWNDDQFSGESILKEMGL